MTLDTSTLRQTVTQEWSVGISGNLNQKLSEIRSGWSCLEHGTAFPTWEEAAIHCEVHHSDDFPPSGFSDSTSLGERVTMHVEEPGQ